VTLETRLLIGLKDILSVQFECRCGARVTRDPEKADRIPAQCGQCGTPWQTGDEESPVYLFVRALRNLRQAGETPFSIRLETNGEPLRQHPKGVSDVVA